MIKILVVLDNDYINDGRVQKEISIFQNLGYDYRILCYDFGKDYIFDPKIIRIKNGKFYKNKLQAIVNSFPLINWIWTKEIKKTIKSFKVSHIHIHDLYMLPSAYNAVKKLKIRPKLILDLHENYPYAIHTYSFVKRGINRFFVRPNIWKKKEKGILEKADTIIVLDQTFGNSLRSKYPSIESKDFVEFPNYPDYNILDKRHEISEPIKLEGIKMFYFGLISRGRGVIEAIKAMQNVNQKNINFSFLLIGPVAKQYKEDFFRELNHPILKGKIQHIPWVNITEILNYMDSCDFAVAPFYINPQIESGIANKIFQYLYGKLPVIVSNARPMAKLVKENDCGIVYKTERELEDAMSKMVLDLTFLKAQSKNAGEVIKQKYAQGIFESRLAGIYESSIYDI